MFLVILASYAARTLRSRAEVSRNGQRRLFKTFLIWLLSEEAKFKYVYKCRFSFFFSLLAFCVFVILYRIAAMSILLRLWRETDMTFYTCRFIRVELGGKVALFAKYLPCASSKSVSEIQLPCRCHESMSAGAKPNPPRVFHVCSPSPQGGRRPTTPPLIRCATTRLRGCTAWLWRITTTASVR